MKEGEEIKTGIERMRVQQSAGCSTLRRSQITIVLLQMLNTPNTNKQLVRNNTLLSTSYSMTSLLHITLFGEQCVKHGQFS